MTSNELPAIDSARYRQVLGHFPTGVVVVSAVVDDEPVGMAIGSFTSVSLDPPLVGYLPTKTSSTWAVLQRADQWAVNILAEDQEDVCRQIATRREDKFEGIGYRAGRTGAPLIDGALAYIECQTDAVHDAGDHLVVLGRVLDLEVLHEGGPLVFFRGGYGRYAI